MRGAESCKVAYIEPDEVIYVKVDKALRGVVGAQHLCLGGEEVALSLFLYLVVAPSKGRGLLSS